MPREYWKPKKKEIEEWFEKKLQEFVIKYNCNTRLTVKKWNNKYIFIHIYKIFFVKFVTKLQEWLARLIDFHKFWKDEWVMHWTLKLIQQSENTDNTITRMVDHWVDSVIGGFVMEFAIDQFLSHSLAE